ncbi:iron-sulfur cluster-binding protein [Haladaptatus litoreus]|uniref:Iron-sulfur cluster-binding protein n=1 Tax=Haladaptatus litoreus TaxID=553468 RepID=A0A1N7DHT8_9EURY|nr:LUD domain-containing protein [Haladaptatus litoreus]SIR75360.1 iron-sulfur cluster-binding protein [Haladaptatus litoreus]
MSSDTRRRKAAKIRHLLETEGESVRENTTHFNEERYDAVEGFDDYEAVRAEARSIKENAIERLPELVERLRDSIEENGGDLYIADDAADANAYIREVVGEASGDTVVKSKSMTTEEIEVNEALEADDVDVWETDLGEFVLQVADEAPSHLVGPSLHRTTDDVADLFNRYFDPDEPFETAEQLTEFARDYLGDRIRAADVGMTGANFVLADSGTITLVTNEGNARKCAVTPDTHIAVTGVEKILPSLSDLGPFIELIARSATGQDISQYVSLFSPPTASPTLDFENPESSAFGTDEDRSFHLVLIDNGRLAMREDEELRETLYCIRCGACANSCANFQHVGGHAFGGETYTGGIATGWETGVHGIESAAEFNDLCTGCSRCVTACPVKIDIPWINTVVRDRLNHDHDRSKFDFLVEGLTPDEEPARLDLQKRAFGTFETMAKVGSKTAPVSNWVLASSPVRNIMDRFMGIDQRRELPSFRRESLVDWFEARGGSKVRNADRTAVLYPDVYTNYVLVERGKAAVNVLESLGVEVRIPDIPGSGRAPLSQGMIDTAESKARQVSDRLRSDIDAGADIVVIEPSDIAMFRRDYEKLLPASAFEMLSENSYEVLEYVFGLLENGADADSLSSQHSRLAYHSHCQQRTLGLDAYTEAVFDRLGYDVITSDVECCGMAGSFGYKSEYYELSMDLGSTLGEQFADKTDRTIVASGTSCTEQLADLLASDVKHPIELLVPDER